MHCAITSCTIIIQVEVHCNFASWTHPNGRFYIWLFFSFIWRVTYFVWHFFYFFILYLTDMRQCCKWIYCLSCYIFLSVVWDMNSEVTLLCCISCLSNFGRLLHCSISINDTTLRIIALMRSVQLLTNRLCC